jgi:hypothetical protein
VPNDQVYAASVTHDDLTKIETERFDRPPFGNERLIGRHFRENLGDVSPCVGHRAPSR